MTIDKVTQTWLSRAKILRAAIRMKHSLAADAEIAAKLEEEKKRFYTAVQHGRLLSPLSIEQVVNQA